MSPPKQLWEKQNLDSFHTGSLVEIMVEIVEIVNSTVQDQWKLGKIVIVDDEINVSKKGVMSAHRGAFVFERDQEHPPPFE